MSYMSAVPSIGVSTSASLGDEWILRLNQRFTHALALMAVHWPVGSGKCTWFHQLAAQKHQC
jgi:hypothetical protein